MTCPMCEGNMIPIRYSDKESLWQCANVRCPCPDGETSLYGRPMRENWLMGLTIKLEAKRRLAAQETKGE